MSVLLVDSYLSDATGRRSTTLLLVGDDESQLIVLPFDLEMSEVCQAVADLAETLPRLTRVDVDCTGLGMNLYQDLAFRTATRLGVPVKPIRLRAVTTKTVLKEAA